MDTSNALKAAANIRAELARHKIPQSHIADRLHLSRAAIGRRMNGQVSFNLAELYAIADELGISVTELIGEDQARLSA